MSWMWATICCLFEHSPVSVQCTLPDFVIWEKGGKEEKRMRTVYLSTRTLGNCFPVHWLCNHPARLHSAKLKRKRKTHKSLRWNVLCTCITLYKFTTIKIKVGATQFVSLKLDGNHESNWIVYVCICTYICSSLFKIIDWYTAKI
jgi:hypothetical protein